MLAPWRVVHGSRPGPVEERARPFRLQRVGQTPRDTFGSDAGPLADRLIAREPSSDATTPIMSMTPPASTAMAPSGS